MCIAPENADPGSLVRELRLGESESGGLGSGGLRSGKLGWGSWGFVGRVGLGGGWDGEGLRWGQESWVLGRDTILLPTLSRTPHLPFSQPQPNILSTLLPPQAHFPTPQTHFHTPTPHTLSQTNTLCPHPNTLSTPLPTPQTHFHTPIPRTPHLPILFHILCPHPNTLSTPLPTPQTHFPTPQTCFHTPTPHTPHLSILSHTPNISSTPSLTSLHCPNTFPHFFHISPILDPPLFPLGL